MRRRLYLAAIVLLSFTSVAVATFVAIQKTKPTTKAGQKSSEKTATQKGAQAKGGMQGKNAAAATPLRPADPNRAPQASVDDALYTNEDFFGANASVARPYAVAFERIGALESQYPKDARLRLHSAQLAEHLGQFDKAAAEMKQYADLKRRSPDSLRRLAQFYHNRAMHSEEVKSLTELARALPVTERAPIYKQAAGLVRSYALKEFKPADFFAELVAADSSNLQPVKDYVQELRLAKQDNEALVVLTQYQPKFPTDLGYFLKTRAAILEERGDRRAAEEVYSAAFDPNWSRKISGDYYELLRRFGRYRIARRALQDRVKSGATDLQTTARLFSFLAYEGNDEQASQVLKDLEVRRAGRTSSTSSSGATPQPVRAAVWTGEELQQTAGMFASIGHFDQASRYLYTLYLLGKLQPASASREEALYRLLKVMIDAAGTPTRVGTGDLSFYKDVAEIDRHPGFMNGVLSLVLSNTSPTEEFATQEKAAAGYFNRAFAYRIFTSFKQEYAQSKYLGEMYLGVVNVFAAMGEHKLAIEAGREFQLKFPDSPSYVDVTLRMADSYVALKDRVNERATILPLLDRLAKNRPRGTALIPSSSKRWAYIISPTVDKIFDKIKYSLEAYSDTYEPTSDKTDNSSEENSGDDDSEESSADTSSTTEKKGVTYSSVLERYVSSLASDDKQQETVTFFWGEIRKHPKEEGLYERFLRWLGQAQLINEQLKAYNSAIRQFDSNTWYHRLARWYVRQKRGKELQRYARQLIDVFDEEEISDYLYRFGGYGATAAGDELNWDQKLAFDLYDYAHKRFPRNLFFVRGILTYLWNSKGYEEWAKLSQQYYFADRSIRDPYLAWLSKESQLRDKYQQAQKQKGTDTNQTASTAIPKNFAYQTFSADAALWLSHHDEVLDGYRALNTLYPGEVQYAERLADLTRSFGQNSDKLYEESAKTLEQLAEVYPANHEFRIKTGEVYAQLGDFKRAGQQWDTLTKLEPGERETYLEVATVYWDYYQFDDSLRVFRDLRAATNEPNLYAYRMGAVYEGKGDLDAAITEYVKVLNEPGDGRDTVAKRLSQLARRKGIEPKIVATYNRAQSADPKDWQLAIGYATYLAESNRQADALALIRTEVARSSDIAFLETVRDLFRAILRPEDEQQVISRLASAARDEREAMMYRLQQASFLERHGKVDDALAIVDKLVADYPTNVGVVEESAKFYWRAGVVDRALNLYKGALAKAQGANRRTITLQLARRQFDANRLDDAEATLRTYYEENRLDTEAFSELAKVLGAANKLDALTELYKSALKDVREAGGDETKDRIAELRGGMIETFDKLKRYEDGIDQYIEIINLFPEDESRLAAAMDYAEKHNLTDRLTAYYEKLTKEAFKNYRWQLVLARIYERRGNIAGASEQYKNAVANDPARPEFRRSLASTLARQKRYDEAISVLRDGWNLSGRDPEWLVDVAQIQISQGKRDDAVLTIRQALTSRKNPKADDDFKMAQKLANWGLHDEAVRVYEQTFARLPKVLKDEYVSGEYITGYVRSLIRIEPAGRAFQKLERLRDQYLAIKTNSKDNDSYRAGSIVESLEGAMRADFGAGVLEYSRAEDIGALVTAIQTATARLTTYSDKEQLLRYIGIAHGAGLVQLEEQLLTRIKDYAFAAREKQEDARCYEELRALLAFYNRRAQFARAAEMLTAQMAADKYPSRFDYQNQIAAEYQLTGDKTKELAALGAAYAAASGELIDGGEVDWVQRYFTLLYETNSRDELQRLAASFNPHQVQLINFFIEKNEKDLARAAIANAKQSPAWMASRSGEVGLFLKDTGAATEASFKAALDLRPIGQMLNRKPDATQTLLGSDWFIAARNYGYWLSVAGRDSDSRKLAPAQIEGSPHSEYAQMELAAYYLDRKDTKRALTQLQLAAELKPGDNDVAALRGMALLTQGDKKGALESWATMMSGRVTTDDALAYLKVTGNNGFLKEALPLLEDFVISFVNRPLKRGNYSDRIGTIKPLIQGIANRADASTQSAVAASFERIMNNTPDDMDIGKLIIEERLLPENNLLPIYRAIHQKYAEAAAATFGTPEYENGTEYNHAYIYPARDLSEWRRKFLDYLIRANNLNEARLLIASIRKEEQEADVALESQSGDEGNQPVNYYDWLPLASALVELRSGRDVAAAIKELRDYCNLSSDNTPTSQEDESSTASNTGIPRHCLMAYTLLVAEKRDAEAEVLLYDAYRKASITRNASDASLAGLAEIEARRGHAEEASRLLRRIVERSTDNQQALRLAAETAGKIERFEEAIEFRQQLARINPDDAANQIELVRALSVSGNNAEAMNLTIKLYSDRRTPNSARAQLAEMVGEITRADRQAGEKIMGLFSGAVQEQEAGALLARASYEENTGNLDAARSTLEHVKGALEPIARLKLGILARNANRDTEAITNFERAVYLDADGKITDAIEFRSPSPRVQLIVLYSKSQRDQAAIRLTEGDSTNKSPLSAAARRALTGTNSRDYEDEGQSQDATLVFEPLLVTRSRVASLRTLSELNEIAASRMQGELLAALASSVERLGKLDQAIALERLRVEEEKRADQKATIEKRIATLLAAIRAREAQAATLLRVNKGNTTQTIYAARVL